jgi:hypothetical protein
MVRGRRTLRSQENGIITRVVRGSEARAVPFYTTILDMHGSRFAINYSGIPVQTAPDEVRSRLDPRSSRLHRLDDTVDTEPLCDDHESWVRHRVSDPRPVISPL